MTRFRNQLLFKGTRYREIEQDRFKQYTDLLLANDPTSNGYADSLDQVLDALSSLIKEGYTKEAQHLPEYTLNSTNPVVGQKMPMRCRKNKWCKTS